MYLVLIQQPEQIKRINLVEIRNYTKQQQQISITTHKYKYIANAMRDFQQDFSFDFCFDILVVNPFWFDVNAIIMLLKYTDTLSLNTDMLYSCCNTEATI